MIKIDPYKAGIEFLEFKDQQEWDDYYSHFKPENKKGEYRPEPYNTPYSFPCLMLCEFGAIIYCPDSNDKFMTFILPEGSYEILEDVQ